MNYSPDIRRVTNLRVPVLKVDSVNGFEDFFRHLSPDGMISVLRFRFFPARETIRLCGIAVQVPLPPGRRAFVV